MHLILCLDDRNGLSFCGRRLSSDRLVCSHMLRLRGNSKLWMNAYSGKLFPEASVQIHDDFFQKASSGEYCFAETGPLPAAQCLESVVIYRWNRHYPSTEKLPQTYLNGLRCIHREEFSGCSHDTITMERYTL